MKILIGLFIMISVACTAQAEIYKCINPDGSVKFTNVPGDCKEMQSMNFGTKPPEDNYGELTPIDKWIINWKMNEYLKDPDAYYQKNFYRKYGK